jgi:hypothetical protein
MTLDISHTILTKSDQLNADDLIGNAMVLNVTGVKLLNSDDQPVVIDYEGGEGRPYKPCKSMRKVLAGLWGVDANQWVGRSMSVYNDPNVKWSGKEVGGIRICGLSHIDKTKSVSMNESKHKKTTYIIEPLKVEQKQRAAWPDDKFNAQFDKMKIAIETGKSTVQSIVDYLRKTADLTDAQIKRLESIQLIEQQSDDNFFGEGE